MLLQKYNRLIYSGILLFVVLFTSCDNSEEPAPHVYIQGEIVNPRTNYLILLKDNNVIDTVYFDDDNQFTYKLKDVVPGLYALKHASEEKILHLAPGDSVLVRANTLDFDESIHFSGPNSKKNNFLTNLYLWNQDNNKLLLDYYKIEPAAFSKLVDSIKNLHLNTLSKLQEKYHFSDNFMEIAQKSIQYQAYDLKEYYTYLVNKYYPDFAKKLTPEFHSYRDSINFNDKIVQFSPIYTRFINHYLINRAIVYCLENAAPEDEKKRCYNIYRTSNIVNRINMIDTLSTLPVLKEELYSNLGILAMTMGKTRDELITVLNLLEEKGVAEKKLYQLRQLGTIQLAFMPGRVIEDVPIVNTSGETVPFQEIISKPTILFIWSLRHPARQEKEHKTIQEYRKKYPEINFIGINVDIGETEEWVQAIRKYGYPAENEFQLGEIKFGKTPLNKDLLLYYLNKMLFLDPSGTVITGDVYLYSQDFESHILEFLNR